MLSPNRLARFMVFAGVPAFGVLPGPFAPQAVVARQGAPAPDAQRIAELTDQLARMQSEIARLQKQVADLTQENKQLKEKLADAGTPVPGDATPPAADPGKPGTPKPSKDDKGKPAKSPFAPLPADAMSAPESMLKAFVDDYAMRVGNLPTTTAADKEKALVEVGKWLRTAKRYRGRVEWLINIIDASPDPLKGGGTITFQVVSPDDDRPYSDLRLTQAIIPGQFKLIAEKSDQKLWKLVGLYSAEPKINKDLTTKGDNPLFIGPFAEMTTTLQVQTLTPAGGTKVKP